MVARLVGMVSLEDLKRIDPTVEVEDLQVSDIMRGPTPTLDRRTGKDDRYDVS